MLLRHLWAMAQTRAEAAGLVLQLQRTAVAQGLLFGAIAAVAGMAFTTAAIVWIAVVAPPEWRGWALGVVALGLLGAAYFAARTAGKRLRRDAGLIADYSRGLKLDLAMVNLALKDPAAEDPEEVAKRERAKQAVREAAMAKAAAPSTAEGGGAPAPEGPSVATAQAAMKAASAPRPDVPSATPTGVEREMPDPVLGSDGAQPVASGTDDHESAAAADLERQRRRRHGAA
jgi:hypothetical protein